MPKERGQKSTNNGQQSIKQKTKDWAKWTLLKTGGELICFRMVGNPNVTSGTHCATPATNPVKMLWKRKGGREVIGHGGFQIDIKKKLTC